MGARTNREEQDPGTTERDIGEREVAVGVETGDIDGIGTETGAESDKDIAQGAGIGIATAEDMKTGKSDENGAVVQREGSEDIEVGAPIGEGMREMIVNQKGMMVGGHDGADLQMIDDGGESSVMNLD
jgi:hypothetical protein